ncbi:MAG: replicative DNA helicase [Firmicutes bacterium]|nr:replicative DNA helicase [Bacillota bacterium]
MADEKVTPRVKPYSEEAEQAVLGSMLMDRDAVIAVMELITEEDFYVERNRLIFRAMQGLYRENSAIDMITLKNRLEQEGHLEESGGLAYIGNLVSAVPSSVYARHYADIVRTRRLYRKFIGIGDEMVSHGYNMDLSIDELSQKVETEVFQILSNQDRQGFSHIHDILLEYYEDIETIARTHGGITGVPTGFADLDRMTTGLQPADLVLVGARPSMGKSAFGLNIVQYAAVRQHKVCAVFSLEMSKKQCANRLLCAEAMVDSGKIRSGRLEDEDWGKLLEALAPLSEAEIYIDDTPGITVAEVRSKCRKLKLEHGLDLIMIDYLQLMSGSASSSENRQQEISEISRSLKALAREMQAPVLALSQLSRALESRSDRRPMLSDLRESGAIEQDADVVMFLYRDEYYNKDSADHNIAEVIISKQRNGSTGTVKLAWLGQYTKFANLQLSELPPTPGP